MKILTKERLSTAATLGTIALIAGVIWSAYGDVVTANEQRQQMVGIARGITELRYATFEYRLYGHDRARTQWLAVSDRLDRAIRAYEVTDQSMRAALDDLIVRRAKSNQLFLELSSPAAAAPSAVDDPETRQRYEERVFGMLVFGQQDSFDDVRQLTDAAARRITEAERRVIVVTLAGLFIIAVVELAASLHVRRAVLRPLAQLQKSTAELAAGRWDIARARPGDDEIGALHRDFYTMADSLRASFAEIEARNRDLATLNQELQAFSYSVSHDLRTPLRSMDGLSLIVLEDYGDRLDGVGKDLLTRIRAASQRMGRLIDDLLRLSLVTRSELKLRAIDFTKLAHETIAALDAAPAARAAQWTVQGGMAMHADAELIGIALQNLLQNAVKFSAGREAPAVHVGLEQRDGRDVYYVTDNGVGFDMAHAGRMFTAFERLHDAAEFPGTGIGLAIVHRIVKRHGGDIWADARAGHGATFMFTLKGTRA